MLNISQNSVLRTEVPMPPFSLQEQFDRRAWSVMELAKKAQQTSLCLEHTWSELVKRAFSGQLTAKWRQAHVKELLSEMELQARQLNLPMPEEATV
jgi:type I restriction enzyme S subunit